MRKVADVLEDAYEALGRGANKAFIYRKIRDAVYLIKTLVKLEEFEAHIDICANTDGYTVALPRDVMTPIAVTTNGQPLYFRDRWYEYSVNGHGANVPVPWTWDDQGTSPTFMDIIVPSYLIAIADIRTDLKAEIWVHGWGESGEIIRSQDEDGVWRDGFKVPVNVIQDYPYGVIVPETISSFWRKFSIDPITVIDSASDHDFVTGQKTTLTLDTPPLPNGLVEGLDYYLRAVDDNSVSLHATREGALSNTSKLQITSADPATVLTLTDTRAVAVQTKFVASSDHNMDTGDEVGFTAGTMPVPLSVGNTYYSRVLSNTEFQVHASFADAQANIDPIDCSTTGSAVVLKAKKPVKPRTKLTFSVAHNFLTGDAVKLSNPTGTLPTPLLSENNYYVRYVSSTQITLHSTFSDAQNGTNPIVITDSGTGTTSVVKRIAASASVGTSAQITANSHNLGVGAFVQFETTGTFPTIEVPPGGASGFIEQNTVYRVKAPTTSNTITVETTTPQDIDFITVGTGQLTLVIARALTVGFLDDWETDATKLANAAPVKFSTNGSLPSTSPAINTSSTYYIKKMSDSLVEIYTDSGLTTKVTVTGLGSGSLFLVKERSVTVTTYSSLLKVSDSTYWKNGSVVQFETTGTLPSPLATATNYKAYVEDGKIKVTTVLDVDVTITAVGSGTHAMVKAVDFTVSQPTRARVVSNFYEDGDKVTAYTDGTLPSPMTATDYYIRRFNDDYVEFYDTEDNAKNLASTTGRVVFKDVGKGINRIAQEKKAIKVSKIEKVRKGSTDSFVSLYAWDDGRDNNLTVIGQYHPKETNPRYRRIKLGTKNSWVRVKYLIKDFDITSDDDYIPIDNPLVLNLAMRTVSLMNDSFTDEAEKHVAQLRALLLSEKNLYNSTPVAPFQVQDKGYTQSDDVMY